MVKIILGADGTLLHDIALPDPGSNGDGQLEIMVQTFDHGMDIVTAPDSGCNCLLWTTARGGPLRRPKSPLKE
jgi:hypothetical protein